MADDTLHRERTYSGLSRGVEGNDLYLAVPEDQEQHGASEVDDLIERLRQTVNRSDAKSLALEDLVTGRTPTPSARINELLAERRRLAPIVSRGPHPPFDALAAVKRDEQLAAERLAAARRERQAAEENLDELGGHRRLTRRRDRQQAETRIKRAEGLETRAESILGNLANRRADLEQQVAEWSTWMAEHGAEVGQWRRGPLRSPRRHLRPPSSGQTIQRETASRPTTVICRPP